MRHRTLKVLIHGAGTMLGRRRLVKIARLVTNEARLDVENDIRHNGETIVQRVARTEAEPVIFDVGCHFGEWSLSLLREPGFEPILHAFEPSAYSFGRASAALAGRGTVHRLALSDKPGAAELAIVHEGAGSNSLVPFTEDRASGETELVPLSTIDQFCAEGDLHHVTLLKIDAEGHDLAILEGAKEMLARQAISMVQFEYNSRWIDARRFLLDAFILLQASGYRMGKVTPRGVETYERWHPELESFREANFLGYLQPWADTLPTLPWWGPA